MKSAELDKLARRHGISPTRPSPDDREVAISGETKRKILSALKIDLPGAADHETGAMRREPKPAAKKIARSFLPEFFSSTRVWGVSLQLYELRSGRNWGIGDFEDLADMADLLGSLGGDFIGQIGRAHV